METGACTAGNCDEQCREHEAELLIVEAGECRKLEVCAAGECREDDTADCDDHHCIKQEARQIVTRLQHDPYRDQGSNRDVQTDQDDPGGSAHSKTYIQTNSDGDNDSDQADDCSRKGLHTHTVGEHTIDDSKNDEQDGNDCRCLVAGRIADEASLSGICCCHECARNNVDEGRDNQDQHQQCEDDEEPLRSRSHRIADDLTNRLSAVAYGSEQGAEVLKAAEEDTADYAPQENREPTENGSLDRTVDRACACDG